MTETLEDKARRLLASRHDAPQIPSGPALLRYSMNCSVYQRPFVVVAEQCDRNTLRKLHSELPQPGGFGGAVSSPAALGAFRFDVSGSLARWPGCPLCGARDNRAHNLSLFWSCSACRAAGRPTFNCAGCDGWGQFRCACGIVVTGPFEHADSFEVCGSRSLPAPTTPRLPPPYPMATGVLHPSPTFALPPVPALPTPRQADTPALLRLPWKR